jgi:hypothetical protein
VWDGIEHERCWPCMFAASPAYHAVYSIFRIYAISYSGYLSQFHSKCDLVGKMRVYVSNIGQASIWQKLCTPGFCRECHSRTSHGNGLPSQPRDDLGGHSLRSYRGLIFFPQQRGLPIAVGNSPREKRDLSATYSLLPRRPI